MPARDDAATLPHADHHNDHERAAQALGKSMVAFHSAVRDARRQFLRLWHQGEQPSKVWSRDRRTTDRDSRDPIAYLRQRHAMRRWRSTHRGDN